MQVTPIDRAIYASAHSVNHMAKQLQASVQDFSSQSNQDREVQRFLQANQINNPQLKSVQTFRDAFNELVQNISNALNKFLNRFKQPSAYSFTKAPPWQGDIKPPSISDPQNISLGAPQHIEEILSRIDFIIHKKVSTIQSKREHVYQGLNIALIKHYTDTFKQDSQTQTAARQITAQNKELEKIFANIIDEGNTLFTDSIQDQLSSLYDKFVTKFKESIKTSSPHNISLVVDQLTSNLKENFDSAIILKEITNILKEKIIKRKPAYLPNLVSERLPKFLSSKPNIKDLEDIIEKNKNRIHHLISAIATAMCDKFKRELIIAISQEPPANLAN